MYAGGAALFAYSGLSFRLSRRFLTISKALIRDGSVRDTFVFQAYRFLVSYFEGSWTDDTGVDRELVEQALRHGQVWDVNIYVGLHCERDIVQGRFDEASARIERLARMAEEYGYELGRANEQLERAYLRLEQRRFGRLDWTATPRMWRHVGQSRPCGHRKKAEECGGGRLSPRRNL